MDTSPSGATAAGMVMPFVARKPEFSQCFGDKAALEELTDGAFLWYKVIVRSINRTIP